jgi:hypothetical protein
MAGDIFQYIELASFILLAELILGGRRGWGGIQRMDFVKLFV